MTLYTKFLLKKVEKQKKYFANPPKYAKEAKRVAEKFLGQAKVFLFGSILTGQATPSSDIDLLIVSPNLPKKQSEQAKIKTKICQKIGPSSPFEIHLVGRKGLSWYRRFARLKEVK